MKKYSFLLLAAMGLLASCAKEVVLDTDTVKSGEKTVLAVNMPEATKTHLGGTSEGQRPVYWSNGDQLACNGVASEALAVESETQSSAKFTFDGVLNTPYKLLYPASAYVDATHITLPAIQTYKAGGIADAMLPMAGVSADGSDITIGHLCAIVRVSIKRASGEGADEDPIVAVSFKGNGNEKVNGTFEISYDTPALTAATTSTEAEKEVKLARKLNTSTESAINYYLVVPARTYSGGFSITVQDEKGHFMTKSKASAAALTAGAQYDMAEITFVPTGTAVGVEISNAQELIDFATAYNSKEYDALGAGLVATLTDDISFNATSSAAFNTVGGIGLKNGQYGASEDYYFNGLFNGNNHTISGLTATAPLFAAVGGNGVVKDFTVDNSCSFTFTHPNTTELDAGAVTGYHKGTMENVDVEANVSLAAVSGLTNETCFGGIAGRIVEGLLDDCSYSGAITVPSGFQSAGSKVQMGGIVGRISNTAGRVLNTDFEGTIDNQGRVSREGSSHYSTPYLMIGGIVGLNAGTVSGCAVADHATGITVTPVETAYTGTIVTHSTDANHYSIAGVAGRNGGTVSDCTNDAAVLSIFSADRTSDDANGRYLEVAGIAGYNDENAIVSGCTNNATIVNLANPKLQYAGGIVGKNHGTVASSDNTSTASITISTVNAASEAYKGGRLTNYGGIVGLNASTGVLSNVHNAAAITVSNSESITSVQQRVGGIVGTNEAAIDGSSESGTITNSGSVSLTYDGIKCETPTASNDYGYFLGGIAGYSTAGISNVSNSGNVTYVCTNAGSETVEGGAQYTYLGGIVGKVKGATHSSRVDVEFCSNSGVLTNNPTSTAPNTATCWYKYNYLGGIAGYAEFVNIKGDSSNKTTNSGNITGGCTPNEQSYHDDTFFVGGIVGYLNGRNSSVNYCDLTGSATVYNNHWTNRSVTNRPPFCGGIAGVIYGTSENHATISNCSIASTATVNGRRGVVGGIVGWCRGGSVSNCTVNPNFLTSSYGVGGIVGRVDYAEITFCTFNGTTVGSSQAQKMGGIVGFLGNASCTINGCNSYATTISATTNASGAIAGTGNASATISNCHYKTGMTLCGDSAYTDGGGNSDDL